MATKLDRKTLFTFLRKAPFGGRLTQENVDGINALVDIHEKYYADRPDETLAILMANVFLETGGRMSPVREGFASSDSAARKQMVKLKRAYAKLVNGFMYYGRGQIQSTWDYNYKKLDDKYQLGVYKNPDKLLTQPSSAIAAVRGCMDGIYTGKGWMDYYRNGKLDVLNSRRVVNGTDKNKLVASYYDQILPAIKAARNNIEIAIADKGPDPVDKGTTSVVDSKSVQGAVLTAAGGLAPIVATVSGAVDNPYALGAVSILAVLAIVAGLIWFFCGRKKIAYETGV